MIIKKLKEKGLFIIIAFEFIYMLICACFSIKISIFRILFFSYSSAVALGAYFALYNPKIKPEYLNFLYLTGVSYIILITYVNVKNYIFYPYTRVYWGHLSGVFIAIYTFVIFYLLFKYL